MFRYVSLLAVQIFNKLVMALAIRVDADGGIHEAELCTQNQVIAIEDSGAFPDASLIVTPCAYKENVLYAVWCVNGAGTSDIPWTRASDATRTNSEGNVEIVPYNLLSYSEQFDNAFWVKQISGTGVLPVVTANSVINPYGDMTADTVVFNRGAGNLSSDLSVLNANVTITNSSCIFSFWAKATAIGDVGKQIFIRCGSAGSLIPITLTPDWVEYTRSETALTVGLNGFQLGSRGIFTVDNSVSVDVWGGQLVNGTSAKPYYKTTDRLDIPRINYPSAGSCPHILGEPQRTNLVTYSTPKAANWNEFGSGTGSVGVITDNFSISPKGILGASKVTLALNGGTLLGDRSWINAPTNPTTAIASIYTYSFWVKASTVGDVGKKFSMVCEGMFSAFLVTLTDEWVRYSTTGTATFATTATVFQLQGTLGTADSVSFDLWNTQMELGSFATSDIETTTATVTRIKDTFSLPNVFTNNLITAGGGAWFVELVDNVAMARDNSFIPLSLADTVAGTTNGLVISSFNASALRQRLGKYVGGVLTVLYNTLTDTPKIMFNWNGVTVDVWVDGVKVVNAEPFTITAMEYWSANPSVTIKIKQMGLWSMPQSDARCQELTTP